MLNTHTRISSHKTTHTLAHANRYTRTLNIAHLLRQVTNTLHVPVTCYQYAGTNVNKGQK